MLRPVHCTLAVLALLLLPAVAAAHGLDGEAADKSTIEFIPLGIEHMLLGWDHLLFILGVVLLAGRVDRAAKLITTFVAGHSFTLILATLMDWRLSPTLVDIVVALSVVTVGVIGVRGRPKDWEPIYVMVGVFGLIHGFGLATRLLDLGVPDDGLLLKTLAFNVGLEVGQLVAIAIVVGMIWQAARALGPRWDLVRRGAYAGMIAAGLIASVALAASGDDDVDTTSRPIVADGTRPAASACTQTRVAPPMSFAGGHPTKAWFGPGEAAPTVDFDHVKGDGYVVVRYSPRLTTAQAEQLRVAIDGAAQNVVGGEDPAQDVPLKASTAYRELRCTRFDLAALDAFRSKWFADVEAGTFRE